MWWGGDGKLCEKCIPHLDYSHPPSYPHHLGSVVEYNNKLVLLGSDCDYSNDELNGSNIVEECDICQDKWTVSYSMPVGLLGHHVVVLDLPKLQKITI